MSKYMKTFLLGLTVGLVFAFLSVSYYIGQSGLVYLWNAKTLPFIGSSQAHTQKYDSKIADELKENVRVLCWIMTCPNNLDTKAIHVRNTWGRRCNKLIFISSENNASFPTVGVCVPEGRKHLTAKTMKAFRYVYDNHFDEADWFMKADDDTYVILENLRYFLSSHSKDDPIYVGHHFKTLVKQGFLSGGAGYVLSKEALRRFGAQGNDSELCRHDGGAEDVEFGKCMQKLGVKIANSTDKYGRSRFHCFQPVTHIMGYKMKYWYHRYDANGAKKGIKSMSDYAISFHYVSPEDMYTLEYLTYHVRPYGINVGNQDLNQPMS